MIASFCAALGTAGCAHQAPPAAPLDATRFASIDQAIEQVIGERRMPGAVFHLERGGMVYQKAFGRYSYEEQAAKVAPSTVFDAASLTKVVATAPSVLLLAEDGRLALDAPLVRYIPECGGGGRDPITVRHLLTHTSGLPAGLPALPAWQGRQKALELACSRVPTHSPGLTFRYSDVNYILLGELVQRVSGKPLDRFAHERIFAPLKMRDSGFLPLSIFAVDRVAPTQRIGGDAWRMLQGEVHDPTARRMDGVAGSAGMFTTVADLARYARMLLAGGELDGVRVLSAESVRLMTTPQSGAHIGAMRGMGMDIDSPFARPRGKLFPVGSYGHTGFTGCILWVDPTSGTFYLLLSNRVYPDDKQNILDLYGRLGTLSAEAVSGFEFVPPAAGAR
ncbi:class A beta-lactamase-related serine hydrolase [Massilia cavernae]|uniref:Class A beta-lactamase-related serine hydrolase n=2 Tax=Massilia cavernae TaxID=2320864 RepID=A0A418XGJ2_9BURK|nr:class A beta-lactamase-related serine hydrolase [Massilia cavernae]